MRYMMFVATDPDGEELDDSLMPAWLADVDGRGKRIMGQRLRPVEDATTVRVRKGELLVTDGPYTEGKEYIGGYYIVDVDSLERAVEIAGRFVEARFHPVDVRRMGGDVERPPRV